MSESGKPLPGELTDYIRATEMEEARIIQQAMVAVEPLRDHALEFAGKYRPVAEVGGDFLDYFWLKDRRLGFYLGDVVGKGLPAALYAALAVGTLRGINKGGERPPAVLELLNKRLRMRVVPMRYCSVQYAVFDPASGKLWYANAGLPLPMHISASGCRLVGEGGLPSGLFADAQYEEHTVQLTPGDAVLFSTDGISEARDANGDDFGLGRLREICDRNRGESADALLARIFEGVDQFTEGARQHDDMTAAVLKMT